MHQKENSLFILSPQDSTICFNGFVVPVVFKRVVRARRLSLRVDPVKHHVLLTMPFSVSQREGFSFLQDHAAWLSSHLSRLRGRVSFSPGVRFPFLGQERLIVHLPDMRGGVWLDGARLCVTGFEEHISRRVSDFLKRTVTETLTDLSFEKAALLGVRVRKVSVRDTSSRWGSCSSDGTLSYSWRLGFAPYRALEYVVCHEVAHLKEMNHSDAFWQFVYSLMPAEDVSAAKLWLKSHGVSLHQYGEG